MKRKVLAGLLISAMVLSTSMASFAIDTGAEMQKNYFSREAIQPYFVGANNVAVAISFSGAKVISQVVVVPNNESSIDYVMVNAQLMKTGSKSAIASWNKKIQKNRVNKFSFLEETKAAGAGTYYVKATIKCYKNEKVIDTINGESKQAVCK